MSRSTSFFCAVTLASIIVSQPCRGGHYHLRCTPSGRVPNPGRYRQPPDAQTLVTSKPAIPNQFADASPTRKRFVLADGKAGEATLTQATTMLSRDGTLHFSGMLSHRGGDVGQLHGGHVHLRVQAVSALPTTEDAGVVLRSTCVACWVPRDVTQPVEIRTHPGFASFADVAQIRVLISYRKRR